MTARETGLALVLHGAGRVFLRPGLGVSEPRTPKAPEESRVCMHACMHGRGRLFRFTYSSKKSRNSFWHFSATSSRTSRCWLPAPGSAAAARSMAAALSAHQGDNQQAPPNRHEWSPYGRSRFARAVAAAAAEATPPGACQSQSGFGSAALSRHTRPMRTAFARSPAQEAGFSRQKIGPALPKESGGLALRLRSEISLYAIWLLGGIRGWERDEMDGISPKFT